MVRSFLPIQIATSSISPTHGFDPFSEPKTNLDPPPLKTGPAKLAVTYGSPFTEILMCVPSQPTATKYQLLVLVRAVVESMVVAVFPVALTENLTLWVLMLYNTSHSE